eukprot:gene19565-23439_t
MKATELYELGKRMKIHMVKSHSKDQMIEMIMKHQDYLESTKKTLMDSALSRYHRGTVEYTLPVLLIYRIIRMVWMEETRMRSGSYYWALNTMSLISKEIFRYTSMHLFTRWRWVSDSRDHFLMPHNIMKHITRLTVDPYNIEPLFKTREETSRNILVLEHVEKLKISHTWYFGPPQISLRTFIGISHTMPRLQSLTCQNFKLLSGHIRVLAQHPLLERINIATLSNDPGMDVAIEYLNYPRQTPLTKMVLPRAGDTHSTAVETSQLASHLVNLESLGTDPYIFSQILTVSTNNIMSALTKLILYNQPTAADCASDGLWRSYFASPECRLTHLSVIIGDGGQLTFDWIPSLLIANRSVQRLEIISTNETLYDFRICNSRLFIHLLACLSVTHVTLNLRVGQDEPALTVYMTPSFKITQSTLLNILPHHKPINGKPYIKVYLERTPNIETPALYLSNAIAKINSYNSQPRS